MLPLNAVPLVAEIIMAPKPISFRKKNRAPFSFFSPPTIRHGDVLEAQPKKENLKMSMPFVVVLIVVVAVVVIVVVGSEPIDVREAAAFFFPFEDGVGTKKILCHIILTNRRRKKCTLIFV